MTLPKEVKDRMLAVVRTAYAEGMDPDGHEEERLAIESDAAFAALESAILAWGDSVREGALREAADVAEAEAAEYREASREARPDENPLCRAAYACASVADRIVALAAPRPASGCGHAEHQPTCGECMGKLQQQLRSLYAPSPAPDEERCECGHTHTKGDPVCDEWGPGYDETTGRDLGGCACTSYDPAPAAERPAFHYPVPRCPSPALHKDGPIPCHCACKTCPRPTPTEETKP